MEAEWRSWIGRSERRLDRVVATPVAALAATLDRNDPPPRDGDVLPPLWHWLFFLPSYRTSDAGPDGHARRGSFLPPIPLPRRMWAGGRLTFRAPLHLGEAIVRDSQIVDIASKVGRSGPLAFVVVRHTISGENGVAIVEEHDIVYRSEAKAGERTNSATPAPVDAAWSHEIDPGPVLLFRYSALTFNSHRIHYDRRYVTDVEGYRGLVVHGPLIATLLVDLLRHAMPAGDARRVLVSCDEPAVRQRAVLRARTAGRRSREGSPVGGNVPRHAGDGCAGDAGMSTALRAKRECAPKREARSLVR